MIDIELFFKNITSVNGKIPRCRIELNGRGIFAGQVENKITLTAKAKEKNKIRIHFDNKESKDTVVDENGKIKEDLSFELQKLKIDGKDIKHLIWQSKYVTGNTEIESCLFFGPKGFFEFAFEMPILKWFLKTNHNINNNDPDWEQDYNFYNEAWQKLSKIQTR